ncbi:MAG: O-antigen ligase [Candidatus Poriferisodalaceae bacterium]
MVAGFVVGGIVGVVTPLVAIGAVGLVGVSVGAAAALRRFEFLVLGLIVLRPAADLISRGDGGGGSGAAIDFGLAIGLSFLSVSVVWLIVQRCSDRWVRLSFASRAVVFYMSIALLSVAYSVDRPVGAESVIRLAIGMTMFLVLEQLLARDEGTIARRVIWAVFMSSTIPILVGYQQLVGESAPVDDFGETRLIGSFVHPNTFATFLVALMLLSIGVASFQVRWWQRAALRMVPLVCVPLMLGTRDRTSWVAFMVGVLIVKRRHVLWLAPLIAVGAFAAFMFVPSVQQRSGELGEDNFDHDTGLEEDSMSWRVAYWEKLIAEGAKRPLTGWGWDQTQVAPFEVTRFQREFTAPPQNSFVRSFVELGLPGLITLSVIIGAIAVELRRRRQYDCASAELEAYQTVAVAVLATLLLQMQTENILTAPVTHWMVLACSTWGLGRYQRSLLDRGDAEAAPAQFSSSRFSVSRSDPSA